MGRHSYSIVIAVLVIPRKMLCTRDFLDDFFGAKLGIVRCECFFLQLLVYESFLFNRRPPT